MHKYVLVIFTVYVSTNKGLRIVREAGISWFVQQFGIEGVTFVEERGERIPQLVQESSSDTYGITGSDLLEEFYLRSGSRQSVVVCGRLDVLGRGIYENYLFGLPTLCLLGKEGISPDTFRQSRPLPNLYGQRVFIPKYYEKLIPYLIDQECIDYISLDGQVDVTAAVNGDYAVDVVGTGRTCKEKGLGIIAKLFESEGIIVRKNI